MIQKTLIIHNFYNEFFIELHKAKSYLKKASLMHWTFLQFISPMTKTPADPTLDFLLREFLIIKNKILLKLNHSLISK